MAVVDLSSPQLGPRKTGAAANGGSYATGASTGSIAGWYAISVKRSRGQRARAKKSDSTQ